MRTRTTVLGLGLRVSVFVASACLVSVASVAACVDLDSLSAGGARPEALPDAGPDTFVPDPCARLAPPDPPTDVEDAGSLPPFELALSTLDLDPASAPGLDLDAVCTCDTRVGTARGGASSCVRPETPEPDCDLDGGADNAIGLLERDRVPTESPITNRMNFSIAEGRRTLLVQISAYNGRANDDDVGVGAIYALGIREQGCPTSTADFDGGPWRPGGCGNDTWTISRASVTEPGGRVLPVVSTKGYVKDFQLVARFGQAPLRLPFGEDLSFPITVAVLTMKLVPLGTDLAPRDPARPPTPAEERLWRVDEGVIAGRVPTEDALEALGAITVQSTAFCTTTSYATVRDSVCRSADIARAPSGGSAACEALSGAGKATFVPARMGAVVDDPPRFAGCDAPRSAGLMVCP